MCSAKPNGPPIERKRPGRRRLRGGFTLVELLLCVVIIALLASLLWPALGNVAQRADSVACLANLRELGNAVQLCAQEHDNTYPEIETDPANPIYPPEAGVKPLGETLKPYGVTEKTLRCRADVKTFNYFATKGSSYEWLPFVDGEPAANPVVYSRRGARNPKPSRLRLVMDVGSVHHGRQNLLYADGHVVGF